MSKRPERQKSKFLGRRRFGRGNVKNRRGSGNKGGRGAAGLHKHKFTWVTKNDPTYFGKHGFSRPNRKSVDIINLYEIENRIKQGTLEKKGDGFYFEFDGKILSTGDLSKAVTIKARAWSKNVEEKVKKSGGSLVRFESGVSGSGEKK